MNSEESPIQEKQKISLKEFIKIIRDKTSLILLTISAIITGISITYFVGSTARALTYVEKQIGSTLLTSLTLVAHILGSVVCGLVIEKDGARIAVAVSFVLLIVGPILMASFSDPVTLAIGKLSIEFGIAMVNMSTPIYVGEISPARARGKLITLTADGIHLGRLLSGGMFILFVKAEEPWRFVVLLAIIPPLVQIIFLGKLPDSPLWHLNNNDIEGCADVLRSTQPDEDAEAEFHSLIQSFQESAQEQNLFEKCKILLQETPLRKAVISAVTVQVIQQLIGIETVLYYSKIVPSKKIHGVELYKILESVGSLINFFLVDTFGRRLLLVISLAMCTISLSLLGALFFLDGVDNVMAIIFICLYICSYSAFFGAAPLVLDSELFPPKYRGLGAGISTISKWLMSTLISSTFLPLNDKLGSYGMVFLYAGFCFVALIVVQIFLPDMTGVSLGNILKKLKGRLNSRQGAAGNAGMSTLPERPSEPPYEMLAFVKNLARN